MEDTLLRQHVLMESAQMEENVYCQQCNGLPEEYISLDCNHNFCLQCLLVMDSNQHNQQEDSQKILCEISCLICGLPTVLDNSSTQALMNALHHNHTQQQESGEPINQEEYEPFPAETFAPKQDQPLFPQKDNNIFHQQNQETGYKFNGASPTELLLESGYQETKSNNTTKVDMHNKQQMTPQLEMANNDSTAQYPLDTVQASELAEFYEQQFECQLALLSQSHQLQQKDISDKVEMLKLQLDQKHQQLIQNNHLNLQQMQQNLVMFKKQVSTEAHKHKPQYLQQHFHEVIQELKQQNDNSALLEQLNSLSQQINSLSVASLRTCRPGAIPSDNKTQSDYQQRQQMSMLKQDDEAECSYRLQKQKNRIDYLIHQFDRPPEHKKNPLYLDSLEKPKSLFKSVSQKVPSSTKALPTPLTNKYSFTSKAFHFDTQRSPTFRLDQQQKLFNTNNADLKQPPRSYFLDKKYSNRFVNNYNNNFIQYNYSKI